MLTGQLCYTLFSLLDEIIARSNTEFLYKEYDLSGLMLQGNIWDILSIHIYSGACNDFF